MPELIEIAAYVGLNDGKDALKALIDSVGALDTPPYHRLLRERPGYQEFQDRKWADTSVVMWSTVAVEIAHQPDELPDLAVISCPTLVMVGELDLPFVPGSHLMAEPIPGAQLEVIPGAGHSPQFEAPDRWIEVLERFLAALPAPVS